MNFSIQQLVRSALYLSIALLLAACGGGGGNPSGVATHSISGAVSPLLSGATMTVSGGATTTAKTDSNGNFSILGLADGDYVITPTMSGYTFNPTSSSVTLSGGNVVGITFKPTPNSIPTYSISGAVSPLLSGATMIVSGAAATTVKTDSGGIFSVPGLADGDYVITPSMSGYTFDPTSKSVTLSGANVVGITFIPTFIIIPTYTISGHITNRKGLAGNTITLSGTAAATTLTDSTGYYVFTGLTAGSYTVTPSSLDPLITYDPAATTLTLGANATVDFASFDTININIAQNRADFDLRTELVKAGWDGTSRVYANVTVASGVVVYGSATSTYAMTLTGVYSVSSKISLINNGYIVGHGGNGAYFGGAYASGNVCGSTYTPGENGGTALFISSTPNPIITNNGTIAGGGGGGGLSGNAWGPGGKGAGYNGSIVPISSVMHNCWGDASPTPTSTAGGALGVNGTDVAAGTAGAATTGAANASWLAIGTILGAQN